MLLVRATFLVALLSHLQFVLAVKHQDFKTCSQSGFCRRGRSIAERARESKDWKSPYFVESNTVDVTGDQSTFSAIVRSSLYPDIKFRLDLSVLEDGVIRAQMDEIDGVRQRYNGAAAWTLVADPKVSKTIRWNKGVKDIRAIYGDKNEVEARVSYSPLRISLLRNGKEEVVINGDGLLHMEHSRRKPEQSEEKEQSPETNEGNDAQTVITSPGRPQAWFEGEKEDDWWEEQFSSWKDRKPKGNNSFPPRPDV